MILVREPILFTQIIWLCFIYSDNLNVYLTMASLSNTASLFSALLVLTYCYSSTPLLPGWMKIVIYLSSPFTPPALTFSRSLSINSTTFNRCHHHTQLALFSLRIVNKLILCNSLLAFSHHPLMKPQEMRWLLLHLPFHHTRIQLFHLGDYRFTWTSDLVLTMVIRRLEKP